jgi:hypothetical protein
VRAPDSRFYIEHAEWARGKSRLELPLDPAPDLVMEIEGTAPLFPRLPIFAAAGVPEIWCYAGTALRVLILDGATHREAAQSSALPGLSAETIAEFLRLNREMKSPAWARQVRAWAQAQRG